MISGVQEQLGQSIRNPLYIITGKMRETREPLSILALQFANVIDFPVSIVSSVNQYCESAQSRSINAPASWLPISMHC